MKRRDITTRSATHHRILVDLKAARSRRDGPGERGDQEKRAERVQKKGGLEGGEVRRRASEIKSHINLQQPQ